MTDGEDEQGQDAEQDPQAMLDAFLEAFGEFLAEGPEDGDFVLLGGRADALAAVEAAIAGPPPATAVIVGEDGVGRTALLRAAARRLAAAGFRVFEASSSDLIAGQRFIGEVEERLEAIALVCARTRAVWLLPDIAAAADAGSYHEDRRGALERVAPFVRRGDARILGQADAAAWSALLQRKPALGAVLRPVHVAPLTAGESMRVVEAWLAGRDAAIEPQALAEAVELGDQFLPDVAYPGRLLRIVFTAHEVAGAEPPRPVVIRTEHVLAALARTTGLPLTLLDHRERLDVASVRSFFESRVLGQPAAVEALVERITMIKAGLTDPTRPLGVFLFVGPTGTGKTELAKALAEYLFGSDARFVRLDMSEYQTPESFERLLAGPDSPEGSELVRSVRRQPFSVVLLDEFEKADPHVWDLFLQVFDDGRLTDRSGSTADFRHTVVILTSNLGAAPRRSGPIGFGTVGAADPPGALERAVADAFRPEFVNRLDRIVAFRPLSREVMRSIVRKELGDVVRRRGLRTRPWAIEWDESAVDLLLERGFSPDLGARPLKRAVDDHLLVPLARTIVEHQAPEGEQFLLVRARDGREIEVQFVDPDAEIAAPPAGRPDEPLRLEAVAARADGTPAEARFLETELDGLAETIEAPGWRARKEAALARMAEPGFWEDEGRFAVLAEAEACDRIEAGFAGARSLLRRLARTHDGGRGSPRLARLLALRLYVLRAALTAFEAGEPADAFVAVRADPEDPEARAFAERLLGMYRGWADERGMRLTELGELAPGGRDAGVLAVSGFGAHPILRLESGLHVLETAGEARHGRVAARVVVAPQPLRPPDQAVGGLRAQAAAALAAAPRTSAIVRRYREHPSPLVRDAVRGGRTGRLDRVLAGDFDVAL